MKELIAEAAESAKRVMNGVQSTQFDDPTPCKDFDVKSLANHMAGLAAMSAVSAQRQQIPAPPASPQDMIGSDPGAAYAPLADGAVQAWNAASLEGNVEFGPGEMPAQFAAGITMMEMAIHGWDLARATGQQHEMSDELAAAVFEVVKQAAQPDGRDGKNFSDQVSVSDGASLRDRVLGYSGRNPNWPA